MARKLAQESEGIIGYWFASEPVLPNGDCRSVVIGETLAVDPPLYLCLRGLHGSEHPFDALQYATGPLLYRCRFSGEILREAGELCASERTALAMVDLTPQLRLFARQLLRGDAEAAARGSLTGAALAAAEAAKAKKSLRDAARAAAKAAAEAAARGSLTGVATAAAWAARAIAWAAHWADASDASDARAARAARAAARDAFMRIVEDAFAGHDLP